MLETFDSPKANLEGAALHVLAVASHFAREKMGIQMVECSSLLFCRECNTYGCWIMDPFTAVKD